MGRRKIEIKRIVDKHDRFICFSKRRKGLFKKANDLALQGFCIIVLVFSKSGNAFVYGSQSAKEVIKLFLNNYDATNGAGSSKAAENLINEMILASETAERTEENDALRSAVRSAERTGKRTREHDALRSAVHSAERTEEIDTSRSETGVASEDSWNCLNSSLTKSKQFWWNSSVENLSWKNLLQFKSAIEDLLSRARTKANSLLVEENFLSGFT